MNPGPVLLLYDIILSCSVAESESVLCVWHVNLWSWKPPGQWQPSFLSHSSSSFISLWQLLLTAGVCVCVWCERERSRERERERGLQANSLPGWRSEWLACICSPLTERLTTIVPSLYSLSPLSLSLSSLVSLSLSDPLSLSLSWSL